MNDNRQGSGNDQAAGINPNAKGNLGPAQPRDIPPAGPHADPKNMDPERTPGAGSLPPIGTDDDSNMQSTS